MANKKIFESFNQIIRYLYFTYLNYLFLTFINTNCITNIFFWHTYLKLLTFINIDLIFETYGASYLLFTFFYCFYFLKRFFYFFTHLFYLFFTFLKRCLLVFSLLLRPTRIRFRSDVIQPIAQI